MLNPIEIIQDCFDALSKEEGIQIVDRISTAREKYIQCWVISTEIPTSSGVKDINLHIGFTEHFPYILPDVYFLDTKYDYFPHIGYDDRKLCLWEDDVIYDDTECISLVRECIKKAKRLIEASVNKLNCNEFQNEIWNHWLYSFNGEPSPKFTVLLYGTMPQSSMEIKVWSYNEISNDLKITNHFLIPTDDVDRQFEKYIKRKNGFTESTALFLSSVKPPVMPPYSVTPANLLSWIKNEDDIKLFKSILNRNREVMVVFDLQRRNYIGGFIIPRQRSKRNGFRPLPAFDELTKFEKRNKSLERLIGKVYSRKRMEERTSGLPFGNFIFAVAGLGSVGSNLCHFLNSMMPEGYVLIDDDILQPENLGRHSLGVRYLYQKKAKAMEAFMRDKFPDLAIEVFTSNLINVSPSELQDCSALFLCTGNAVVEKAFLQRMLSFGKLPIFILWLEPFALAGHMVYINPKDMPPNIILNEGSQLLYKHNLIKEDEYKKKAQNQFVKHEAGCNGSYALYSNNDVFLFLSALHPIINRLLQNPEKSKCYRWIGNIEFAKAKNIELKEPHLRYGCVSELPL
ncbi:hypothetical protein IX326_000809 [Porphyromonas levii]|nr:ThiF family adenylyltransferase [Porphyromonas levii]MBR8769614.1 hypothetical protein [Porphyromonas levii]